MKISIIGLGKLGACSAACFAYRGFDTIGVDINKSFVDAINHGKAPVYEPRLQEFITASRGRLRATQSYEEAIRESDITFLIVPTPSRHDGSFSDRYLQDALTELSKALKKTDKKYHLFAITSTVSPGTTDEALIPLIESVSGRKNGKGFDVAYNPEFIALGDVINGFLKPDMLLIGESDRSVGDKLEKIYLKVCENKPYMARMSIVSAEITKIVLNSYVTMKISFANNLANICEKVPGAEIDKITAALGSDRRISPYYLKGGLSYGGPCFPRDNRAFNSFAKKCGLDTPLADSTDEINKFQVKHVTDKVLGLLPKEGGTVAVLGLSYKTKTPVIEESASIKIISQLLERASDMLEITVYDPLAMDNARALFGDDILYASSMSDCLAKASVVIITTPEDEFKGLKEGDMRKGKVTIIDCWRILDPKKFSKAIKYIALGRKS